MPAGFDEKTRIEDGSSSIRSATAASAAFGAPSAGSCAHAQKR